MHDKIFHTETSGARGCSALVGIIEGMRGYKVIKWFDPFYRRRQLVSVNWLNLLRMMSYFNDF